MKSKSCCNLVRRSRTISRVAVSLVLLIAVVGVPRRAAAGSEAPSWMHAAASAPLPSYDEKTKAVLLYSETNVTVISTDKVRRQVREAYKILRPEGRGVGTIRVYLDSDRKVISLHGWCIPAQGKDFEVKDKEATEVAPPAGMGGILVEDFKVKVLQIPAPETGNVVGYEYEVEEDPIAQEERWGFQEENPVRESHFSLQLPSTWEYKAYWMNHPEVSPIQTGNNQWQWVVKDVKGIRPEHEMPPWHGVAGQMILSLFPPGETSAGRGFAKWNDTGDWYTNLVNKRLEASDGIKQKVATLTTGKATQLQKMQAIASFIQQDIRYVGIELGIGGYQPHFAAEVFQHRYGDCKDKATLTRSMLQEIGVNSYYIVINATRGSVTDKTPPQLYGFNHMIAAIKLPDGMSDPSLVAIYEHPTLGRLLFFDPTDEVTPFGQIRGELQGNYGLLVAAKNSELVQLPEADPAKNSIERTAKLALDANGDLRGDVTEVRVGDRAWSERMRLRNVAKDSDRVKSIEDILGGSLSTFHITHASLVNFQQTDAPFGFRYSFESEKYAKSAGDMILLRPRVLGVKAESFLEVKEPREFPIEFAGPVLDKDSFEIALPAGYVVDDLPEPVDVDYGFASYHSKTEVKPGAIEYTRTFEVKDLSVPAEKSEELRKFYRIIANDERSTVVLKAQAK